MHQDSQETISRLKKEFDNVFAETVRAGRDVEPLVLDILVMLKRASADDA